MNRYKREFLFRVLSFAVLMFCAFMYYSVDRSGWWIFGMVISFIGTLG